ncbi:MAG: T9SS type B sorting domain-containing protein [Bacteroidota bacterium]
MRKWILHIACFFVIAVGYSQDCPNLLDPTPGSTNIPVTTSISWSEVTGVPGYIISLGTTPGGTDILNEQSVGSATTYNPPLGLPESTTIHVTVTMFFFDQPDIVCELGSFTTENVTTVPDCTQLNTPLNGDIDINAGTNLSWNYAARATGYRLTIGTAPGTGDILNNFDLGNTLFYNPPTDLPTGAEIFVRITPYNENGNAVDCPEESFTTGDLGDPPGCTTLVSPMPGEMGVQLSPLIEWLPVDGATGYILFIGTTPFINDIVDGLIFTATSTFVIEFESNRTYFIRIIPFNEAGQAQDCEQWSFSTVPGCGPFIDPVTGEIVTLNPEITLPDVIGICENNLPTRINAPDQVDGYRWYKILPSGDEVLLSEEPFVDISETGPYRYEIYLLIDQEGVIIECSSTKEFTVVSSATAVVENVLKEEDSGVFTITVIVSGIGDYEFSLNDVEGPYSDQNVFFGLTEGTYTVYIRDKNGCGVIETRVILRLPPTGFPTFFSPNNDGIKDYWQYVPPRTNALPITTIFIYDRYGKLLSTFRSSDLGWDGTYNGELMPSSSYWYEAFTSDNRVFRGFFTLARSAGRN